MVLQERFLGWVRELLHGVEECSRACAVSTHSSLPLDVLQKSSDIHDEHHDHA